MDPDATLKELRELIGKTYKLTVNGDEYVSDDWHQLATLAEALDEWICKGGFLPKDWQK